MVRTAVLLIFLVLLLSFSGCAVGNKTQQSSSNNENAVSKKEYIPPDLHRCYSCLDKMLTPEQRDEMKNCKSEEEMVGKYHFGLGMGLRNGWGLWANSRLAEYFNEMGVYHPDDMSSIILKSYWLKLNGKRYDIVPDIVHFQRYALQWMIALQPDKMKCPRCGAGIEGIYPLDCAIKRDDGTAFVFQVLRCDNGHNVMFDGKELKTLNGPYEEVFTKAMAKDLLKLEPLERKGK